MGLRRACACQAGLQAGCRVCDPRRPPPPNTHTLTVCAQARGRSLLLHPVCAQTQQLRGHQPAAFRLAPPPRPRAARARQIGRCEGPARQQCGARADSCDLRSQLAPPHRPDAAVAKYNLEEMQRAEKRERERQDEAFAPRWFRALPADAGASTACEQWAPSRAQQLHHTHTRRCCAQTCCRASTPTMSAPSLSFWATSRTWSTRPPTRPRSRARASTRGATPSCMRSWARRACSTHATRHAQGQQWSAVWDSSWQVPQKGWRQLGHAPSSTGAALQP